MDSVMIPVVLQSPHKTLLVESISYGFGCAMRRRTSTYLKRDPDIFENSPESSSIVLQALEGRAFKPNSASAAAGKRQLCVTP